MLVTVKNLTITGVNIYINKERAAKLRGFARDEQKTISIVVENAFRSSIRNMIGVYILIKDFDVIYIGQSLNVELRIYQHRKRLS